MWQSAIRYPFIFQSVAQYIINAHKWHQHDSISIHRLHQLAVKCGGEQRLWAWCGVHPGHVANLLQGYHRDEQPFTFNRNLKKPVQLICISLDIGWKSEPSEETNADTGEHAIPKDPSQSADLNTKPCCKGIIAIMWPVLFLNIQPKSYIIFY